MAAAIRSKREPAKIRTVKKVERVRAEAMTVFPLKYLVMSYHSPLLLLLDW